MAGAIWRRSVASPRFLLDTNILIYILDDAGSAAARHVELCEPGSAVTSAIAVAEAAVGFARQGFKPARFDALLRLIEPQPFDLAAGRVYGRLPFRRNRFDQLIAAHALALGLTLVTNNEQDFSDITNLSIANWTR